MWICQKMTLRRNEDGFWRKIKVTWVLDEEESQASSYDGKTPGVYLFRAKQKSSNYVVDEEELPTIQITVMEKGQETTVLEFVPLEETVVEQYLSIGSKESDIQLPEQLTVRETTGRRDHRAGIDGNYMEIRCRKQHLFRISGRTCAGRLF